MITKPSDVLSAFPIRKSKKQKQDFRNQVISYTQSLGLSARTESASFGAQNIVIGDPERAKILVTAHYDTPARLPFPNFITPCNLLPFILYQLFMTIILLVPPVLLGGLVGALTGMILIGELVYFSIFALEFCLMLYGPANPSNANDNTSGVITLLELATNLPKEHRDKVCFVLFDLEEGGLIGSASYRKAHKTASNHQTVLNLDCVGNGDHIILFPSKQLKKRSDNLNALKKLEGYFGQKTISVRCKGFSYYPSDQKHFPLGVGIAAFRHNKYIGPYCNHLHTPRDTILDYENITTIRNALITFITENNETLGGNTK